MDDYIDQSEQGEGVWCSFTGPGALAQALEAWCNANGFKRLRRPSRKGRNRLVDRLLRTLR